MTAVTDRQEGARGGRSAQRRRTRAAIVSATAELIAGGRTPSIDEIAAAAEVSRRTIYLHFPTLDQLLLDATAGLLSGTVDEHLGHDDGDDVLTRTDTLARALVDVAPTTLPLGRKIIALKVDAPPAEGGRRRGYRRPEPHSLAARSAPGRGPASHRPVCHDAI